MNYQKGHNNFLFLIPHDRNGKYTKAVRLTPIIKAAVEELTAYCDIHKATKNKYRTWKVLVIFFLCQQTDSIKQHNYSSANKTSINACIPTSNVTFSSITPSSKTPNFSVLQRSLFLNLNISSQDNYEQSKARQFGQQWISANTQPSTSQSLLKVWSQTMHPPQRQVWFFVKSGVGREAVEHWAQSCTWRVWVA